MKQEQNFKKITTITCINQEFCIIIIILYNEGNHPKACVIKSKLIKSAELHSLAVL